MKRRLPVSLSSGRRIRLGRLGRLLAVCFVFAVVPPIASGADTWSATTDLSATLRDAYEPQVALSSDGTRATAVWYRSNGTNTIVQSASATISAGTATWGAVTDLSAGSAQTFIDSGFGLQAASSSRLWRASSYSTGVSLPRARWRRRRL